MTTDSLQKRLAYAIRVRREALPISQEAFADHVGLHRTYYSSIERGERNVSLKNMERIATGLGVRLSRLLIEAEDWRGKPPIKRTPAGRPAGKKGPTPSA
jgi:transcriptional regulator with XRE-family HTH domain